MMHGEHGPRLRREREDAGVTLNAIAAELGLARTTVWRYEGAAYVKAPTTARYRAALQAIKDRTVQ